MPEGEGTYGSKRGRPPAKKKSPIKNMAYWKAKSDASPNKFIDKLMKPIQRRAGFNPNESVQEERGFFRRLIDRKTEEKVEEKIDEVVNQKSGDGITV